MKKKNLLIMLMFVPLLMIGQTRERELNLVTVEDENNETRIKVPGATVIVNHFGDTVTTIYLGNNRRLEIIDSFSGSSNKTKVRMVHATQEKFKGHWGGFSLGYNYFGNSYFTNELSPDLFYLDLNNGKSIEVGLNLFQQSIGLQRNKNNIGLVTGLGLTLNNYRFDTQNILYKDRETGITGYRVEDKRIIDKNKLLVRYITVPLLFEFQIPDGEKNPFYINAGVYGGFKLSSHVKVKYADSMSPIKQKYRHDLNINTFKYGATARIGYRWLNLYATCDLSSLFQKGKGPEIYPWSIGIMLVSF